MVNLSLYGTGKIIADAIRFIKKILRDNLLFT